MTEARYPTVHVDVSASQAPIVSELLWKIGATGVEERDASTLDRQASGDVTLIAHFDSADDASQIASMLAERWPARVVEIVGDAWRDEWKRFFKPTRIGKRLVIRPSWEPFEPKRNDVVLTLDPGQAFGTGTHETTRLVLGEIERLIRGGESVLDVGAGSGILSIASILLGAKRALAIDVDPDAVQTASENAELNHVSKKIRNETTPVEKVRGSYDLVVANIQATVLGPMAKTLIKRVRVGGTLVLSGLLLPDEEEMRAAFKGGLRALRRGVEGEWLALTFRRTA